MDGDMTTIYLAGPITGLTDAEASGWRDDMAARMADLGIDTRDPMRGNKMQVAAMDPDRSIVMRDRNDVNRSDLMFVDLIGAKWVSIGTMVEYGWASAAGVPIVTLIEDTGNVHDHGFVRELSAFTSSDREEAVLAALYILNRR